MAYGQWLKHIEVRTITMWSIVLFCLNGITDYLFVIGFITSLGISNRLYIYGSIFVFGIVGNAISFLPIMALFAKIIPAHIEGTMFAFLTGISNLSSTIISSQIGYFINERFFNVTSSNMSNYRYLTLVTMLSNFLGFLLLQLIPTSEEIKEWKEEREEDKISFSVIESSDGKTTKDNSSNEQYLAQLDAENGDDEPLLKIVIN